VADGLATLRLWFDSERFCFPSAFLFTSSRRIFGPSMSLWRLAQAWAQAWDADRSKFLLEGTRNLVQTRGKNHDHDTLFSLFFFFSFFFSSTLSPHPPRLSRTKLGKQTTLTVSFYSALVVSWMRTGTLWKTQNLSSSLDKQRRPRSVARALKNLGSCWSCGRDEIRGYSDTCNGHEACASWQWTWRNFRRDEIRRLRGGCLHS